MPTLTPTHATGARGKAMPMVSHPPGRGVDDQMLASELPDHGMNTVFVADFLSAVVAHERAGRHLYRSVAGRTLNPMLRSKYEEYGRQTERHVEVLEQLIADMGGDPQYVSPTARGTVAAGKKIVESTFALGGSVDVMTAEMMMLDAVLLAESIDHANWTAMAEMADGLPRGEAKQRFRGAVAEVLEDEEEHLDWAREMRTRMIVLQANHETATTVTAKVEELTERVRNWFT